MLLPVMTGMLTACSSDDVPKENGNTLQIVGFTRAGEATKADNAYSPLKLYFYSTDDDQQTGQFFYNGAIWRSAIEVTAGHKYSVYGYAPATGGTCEVTSINHSGATLEIRDLTTVNAEDVCIVVGVQQLESSTTEKNIPLGKFDFEGQSGQNYINVLVDHIYASLQCQFKVDPTYNAIRCIHVTKLELATTKLELATTKTYPTGTMTVSLAANGAENDPITDLTWTLDALDGGEPRDPITIFETNTNVPEIVLGTDWSVPFGMGCYVPNTNVTGGMTLITTYDIYDRKGNLIRQDCKASNKIAGKLAGHTRGQRVTLQITVAPTYLYQLSDPDLDNPEFTVNGN
jgi:hypothetical protein